MSLPFGSAARRRTHCTALHELEAARGLYTEMGAPAQVARLAQEIRLLASLQIDSERS